MNELSKLMKLGKFRSLLLAAMVIPTSDLSHWKIEQFSGRPKNKVSESERGLRIAVDSSAGLLIYPLKIQSKVTGFSVKGEFYGLPNFPESALQGQKGHDDYPLRIGFVIPGEKRLSGIKKLFAADWVRRLYQLAPEGIGLDSVHFYNVTQNANQLGKQRLNPESELFREDFFSLVSKPGVFSYVVKIDPPIDVIAIWVSIDGDDTRSAFDVFISQLELQVQ